MTDAEEPKPWVKWRSMTVCANCWIDRKFDQAPARVLDAPEKECIVCEEPTTSGIYVRMRVEWR
jgi:hypothetical protein